MTTLAPIPEAILIWPFGHGHSTAGQPESYGYQGLPEGTVQVGKRLTLGALKIEPLLLRLFESRIVRRPAARSEQCPSTE
jgi:hypothetical protein